MIRKLLVIILLLSCPTLVYPVNGRIVGKYNGIQVVEVWGSNREMGESLGALQGRELTEMITFMRQLPMWQFARERAEQYAWNNDELEILQAMDSLLSDLDLADLMAVNTYGDWSYNLCRGLSVWGELVDGSGSLSVRKLIKGDLPGNIGGRHAIICFQPNNRPAWVNFAFPGAVLSYTGLNEYGWMFALHDHYSSGETPAGLMSRSGACAMLSRAVTPDEAEYLLQENPGSTGSYLYFWGGSGVTPGGAVFSYGRAAREFGSGDKPVRRNACPSLFGGTALSCGNDKLFDGYGDCNPGEQASEVLSKLGVKPVSLDNAEEVIEPGSQHTVYSRARGRRDISFRMYGRIDGRQWPTPVLEWSEIFSHMQPEGEMPKRIQTVADETTLNMNENKTLEFTISGRTFVHLGVYSADGTMIRPLVNRILDAGCYLADPGKLKSGEQVEMRTGEWEVSIIAE